MAAAAPTPDLLGEAAPSPAGPLDAVDDGLRPVPELPLGAARQTYGFVVHPIAFAARAEQLCGEVHAITLVGRRLRFNVSSHPDHVKALFRANPAEAPSLAGQSPLRPILGPSTVLTANGARHLRQRKLLLPSFHGDAIAFYVTAVERAISEEIDRWASGTTLALAPRMAAVTLDVIMAGVFGYEGRPAPDSPEAVLRTRLRRALAASTRPWFPILEQPSAGHDRPRFPLSLMVDPVYRALDDVIAARRALPEAERGADVLSLLLSARDEAGAALTSDEVARELLTLVLAGHETSANSLAWIMERMVRNRPAYDTLRDAVRGADEDQASAWIDAAIHEGMRVRPVIGLVGRQVQRPWRLGDFVVPAGSAVSASILGLHRRPDLYPRPLEFLPERFLGVKPGTYTWIPFGGGTRRCLGASLAMAEQRVVLRELTRRVDMTYDRQAPEAARMRNVTIIPARGGRVVLQRVSAA